jgi:enoyl-CoA hydratase/carnithine racemase
MLTHCDFVYASESAKFRMPFIDLAVVPEFGSSRAVPAGIGHIRAAELILLGLPFNGRRAAELGFVAQVVPDQSLLATATEGAWMLAAKSAFRDRVKAAMKRENKEFRVQVRSDDAKEALATFLEKRAPTFAKIRKSATAA